MATATLEPEPARPHDLAPALDLLKRARLPQQGVAESFGHYLVVKDVNRVVALCGVEVYGEHGLLRSVVVDPIYRGQGLGAGLVEGAVSFAGKLRLTDLYLLTETARDFFKRHGFEDAARDTAPDAIRESWEFKSGCPVSSTFMRRAL